MKNLICGMRFVGSNNVRLEGVNGPMASGILVDRLPPTRWDVSVDPEWIVNMILRAVVIPNACGNRYCAD